MAKMSIIKECVEIIRNNIEEDCEYYGINYYLSYKNGKIRFIRTTSSLTGETYSNGEIDTKTSTWICKEWDATIEDYCNLAIVFCNGFEHLIQYEYGEEVGAIQFLPIL